MANTIGSVIVSLMITILLVIIYIIIKTRNSVFQHKRIMAAIMYYTFIQIAIENNMDFTMDQYFASMESLESTTMRLLDWGNKHILPEDMYNDIESYIF